MFVLLVGLLLLSCVFHPARGLLGGLVGAFVGALVLTGMASTASNGDLAALYSPVQLAWAAGSVAVVGAVLAVVAPYATGLASLGWAAGALLAALVAPRTDQAIYVLPLVLHVFAAAAVVALARRRAAVV